MRTLLLHPTRCRLQQHCCPASQRLLSCVARRNRDPLCGRLRLPKSKPKLLKPTTLNCTNLSKTHNMLLGQTSRCIHCFQNYSQRTFHIYTCPSVSLASEPHDAQNTQKIMRSNLPQVVQFIYVRVIICAMMCNNKIHILEGELSPCKASQEASQIYF